MRIHARSVALFVTLALASCKTPQTAGPSTLRDADALDAPAATDPALAAAFQSLGVRFVDVGQISVDVENTTAFWAKVEAVEKATKSIDIAYFLMGDDYAGSHVGKLLVEKAKAGVKVRIMVDAKTTMGHRDFFKTLVAKGAGNLQVAYFRPVPKVIYDDMVRLGLDPEALVAALGAMDTAAIQKQIAQSQVLKGNAALMKDVSELIRSISQPSQADVPTAAEQQAAEDAEKKSGKLAQDAILALRVARIAKEVKETYAQLGLKATGRDWFDVTKWTHHKLLLVDGERIQGGGRNLEDAYHWEKDHKIKVEEGIKKYVFMDVDYYFDNADVGRAALATYDKYWGEACFAEPPLAAACESGIPMGREVAADDATAAKIWKEIEERSAKLVAAKDYERTYVPVHKGIFTQAGAKVAYAENRMFPAASGGGKLLYEEPSQHNAALVAMIDSLKPGQDVVFQNAYLYFPAGIQLSLMRAMKRGVNVIIQSNSPESSDLGYVAQAARLQYENFLKLGDASPGKMEIYEYLTEESLHAKVEIIGDRWLVVGSINADPRCEYLDTNNGVIIDSPELAKKYKAWLAELRGELLTQRTRKITAADGTTKEQPLLRKVDMARIQFEKSQPVTDPLAKMTRSFSKLAEQTFEDSEKGAAARKLLQAIFLQY